MRERIGSAQRIEGSHKTAHHDVYVIGRRSFQPPSDGRRGNVGLTVLADPGREGTAVKWLSEP
jgi:hypothetical protein